MMLVIIGLEDLLLVYFSIREELIHLLNNLITAFIYMYTLTNRG